VTHKANIADKTSRIIALIASILAISVLLSTSVDAQTVAASGERAVLEHFNSNGSIFLVSDEDTYAEAQQLEALHGVDTQQLPGLGWSGGPMHRGHFSSGSCSEVGYNGGHTPPTLLDLNAKIDAAWTDPNSSASFRSLVYKWLIKNGVITVKVYTITYPNVGDPGLGQHYRAQLTYYCPIIFRDSHSGLKIPIGKRSFTNWTYKNQYETPVAGKGNVKVFAGIFNYSVIPSRPWSLSPAFRFRDNAGTVTVKAYLDPDNGRWVISNWEMADPGLDLNSAEWKQLSTESLVAPTVSRSAEGFSGGDTVRPGAPASAGATSAKDARRVSGASAAHPPAAITVTKAWSDTITRYSLVHAAIDVQAGPKDSVLLPDMLFLTLKLANGESKTYDCLEQGAPTFERFGSPRAYEVDPKEDLGLLGSVNIAANSTMHVVATFFTGTEAVRNPDSNTTVTLKPSTSANVAQRPAGSTNDSRPGPSSFVIAQPELVLPRDGSVFAHYPRAIDLTWKPIPLAVSYSVELQFDGSQDRSGHWIGTVMSTSENHFATEFVGARPGRWRIWATNASGEVSQRSSWSRFLFIK
jgi:hypothetical protein